MFKIIDGDTFDATDGNIKFHIRIAGMDAPEKGSPFSKMATVELSKRIEGKSVKITSVGTKMDRYNRVLGQVMVDERDVGIELIELGLATYYRPGCVDYPMNKKSYNMIRIPMLLPRARLGQKIFGSGRMRIRCCRV